MSRNKSLQDMETLARLQAFLTANSNGIKIQAGKTANALGAFAAARQDSANDVKYFGFLNAEGNYYFIKYDTTAGTLLYHKGTQDMPTAWADRTNKVYVEYNEVKW